MPRVLVLSILPKVRMIKGLALSQKMNTKRLQPQPVGNARKVYLPLACQWAQKCP